ncbi:MAG: hypothetical protein IJ862_00270 [Selenomonadaceae bacterium]|nr:hypothetical protein [Selenomonadaceae bacterium]
MATIKITSENFNKYGKVTVTGTSGNDVITVKPPKVIGFDYEANINAGDGNDKITINTNGGFGVSGTIIGGKGNDTIINNSSEEVSSIYYADGDGKDIIKGSDKIHITSGTVKSYKISGTTHTIKVGSGSITLKNIKNKANTRVYVEADSSVYIAGRKFNDTDSARIYYNGGETLIGTSSDDYMVAVNDDTVIAGKGNDYIVLDDGDSCIQYTNGDGNDTITGYEIFYNDDDIGVINIDTIKIIGSSYTKTTKGKDVILKVGSGSMTIKNGKGWDFDIIAVDDNGKTIPSGLSYSSDYATATLDNNFSGDFLASNYKSSIATISAAKRTKAIKITGNAANNLITGGSKADSINGGDGADTLKGGNGNDTLSGGVGNDSLLGGAGNDKLFGDSGADTLVGGKGNDTFTGGDGNDVFFYTTGDGNDVIADFTSGDIIKLGSKKTKINEKKSKVSGNDYILTIGSNTIKLKGAATKSVTVVDYAGTSKVYNPQSSYEERWFINGTEGSIQTEELSQFLKSDANIISSNYGYKQPASNESMNQILVNTDIYLNQ